MDAGGRATHRAVAEELGEILLDNGRYKYVACFWEMDYSIRCI
jgi:hypothetical protein